MDGNVISTYVQPALRLCGQLNYPGGQPSPEAQGEATGFLNQLLDSWNTMRNMVFTMNDLTFNMTSGQNIYTIGPGADFNGPRPVAIQKMDLIYQTAPQIFRLPVELIDVDQWAAERVPDLQNAISYKCYYDNGYSSATPTDQGTLYFWPGPATGYQVEMWIWNQFNVNLVPSSTLYVPPGYQRTLVFSLAAEILPLYPKRVTPEREAQIMRTAHEARSALEALNAPAPIVSLDPAIIGGSMGFNWLVSTN